MKAKILADRLGIDLASLSELHPGETLVEDMVKKAAKNNKNLPEQSCKEVEKKPIKLRTLPQDNYVERVLILGAGGGAALVLDILSRSTRQKAVGILDNNSEMAGNRLMGIPVLGQFGLIDSLWRDSAFDVLISTVVRDVGDRASIFERYTNMGIPFANIIDPDVRIGREVKLGTGNLIIYGSYLAASVKLGDNNFLAAGTSIEHHSTVGSHCTFGPRTSLSGKVSVGDKVKFGTQVAVEPNISIGAGSIIASGVILTSHIVERSIVKSTTSPAIRLLK
jgi:sugar O-acyltransferase (sialic acid O-acetyltransferase NeuD family)